MAEWLGVWRLGFSAIQLDSIAFLMDFWINLVTFWCHFGFRGAPRRLLDALGGPRGDLGVLEVTLGWPRGRPDSKIHDFAETVAYFKGSQGSPQRVRQSSTRHQVP